MLVEQLFGEVRHLCGLLVSAGKARPSCTPPAPPPTKPLAPLVENPIKKEKNKMRQTNEAQKVSYSKLFKLMWQCSKRIN